MALEPGRMLGSYQVFALIGEGGRYGGSRRDRRYL